MTEQQSFDDDYIIHSPCTDATR